MQFQNVLDLAVYFRPKSESSIWEMRAYHICATCSTAGSTGPTFSRSPEIPRQYVELHGGGAGHRERLERVRSPEDASPSASPPSNQDGDVERASFRLRSRGWLDRENELFLSVPKNATARCNVIFFPGDVQDFKAAMYVTLYLAALSGSYWKYFVYYFLFVFVICFLGWLDLLQTTVTTPMRRWRSCWVTSLATRAMCGW